MAVATFDLSQVTIVGGSGINPGTTYYANKGPGGFEGLGAVATNIGGEWQVV